MGGFTQGADAFPVLETLPPVQRTEIGAVSSGGVTASPVALTNATPGKPYSVQVLLDPLVKTGAKLGCPAP
jgi:hypothetical protein